MLQEKWQNDANDKAIKLQKFAAFRVVCVYFFSNHFNQIMKREKKNDLFNLSIMVAIRDANYKKN